MKESEVQERQIAGSVRTSPPEAASADFRLGREARFLLVAVGGGAIRVVRSAARQGMRYVETVAINGDDRVVEAIDFHRRVRVALPQDGSVDDAGLPLCQPLPHLQGDLDRIFEGSTFVTIVASLGGEAGTEVLPSVLDAAARHAPFLSVFLMKPFACEEERRLRAEHALEAVKAQGEFAHRVTASNVTLRVLDNESAYRTQARRPFNQLCQLWGDVIASHVHERYVLPAESALEEYQLSREVLAPINRPPEGPVPPTPLPPIPAGLSPMPEALPAIPVVARLEPTHEISSGPELEIHFEIGADAPASPPRPHLV
ncbi:MAG: hypothetical protein KGJ23_00925 [Euryarchaeota archaeon]|nr:hypothetical protein [Euryarchaeota archaeon]MDE1835159.1 hypothetical protein [Euryarchaeota archaeon]MDE1880430.1 hypothetical protein [Euryarchaeota archaeon]MDE2045701.1 hypothetical protein [Thermoplasmata archaeon]